MLLPVLLVNISLTLEPYSASFPSVIRPLLHISSFFQITSPPKTSINHRPESMFVIQVVGLLTCIGWSNSFAPAVFPPRGSLISTRLRLLSDPLMDERPAESKNDDVAAIGASLGSSAFQSNDLLDGTAAAASRSPGASTTSSGGGGGVHRQALYGTELEMPSSYVRCGKCLAIYAMTEEDLGGRGRRLECAVCAHSWFQSKDRILTVTSEFELTPMRQRDVDRIKNNVIEGKEAKFTGDMKLYVGNISFQCSEDDLYELFGQCGEVGEVTMVKDEEGKNRGFGFVTMRTVDGGDKAIAELDGTAVRGRNLAVRASNT
jgi:predicted Zn finger-like uncharacterized protein